MHGYVQLRHRGDGRGEPERSTLSIHRIHFRLRHGSRDRTQVSRLNSKIKLKCLLEFIFLIYSFSLVTAVWECRMTVRAIAALLMVQYFSF